MTYIRTIVFFDFQAETIEYSKICRYTHHLNYICCGGGMAILWPMQQIDFSCIVNLGYQKDI